MPLVVVNRHPNTAVLPKQFAQELQARQHHAEPLGVLQVVVVMLERAFGVVWRVNKDALHLPPVKRQQRLERFEVVPLNQQVVVAGGGRLAMHRYLLQQPVRYLGCAGEG